MTPYSADELAQLRGASPTALYGANVGTLVGRLLATVEQVTDLYRDAVTERGMIEGQWRRVMPYQWEYIALVVECVDRDQPVPAPEVDGGVVYLWASATPGGSSWRVGLIGPDGYVSGGAAYDTPAEMAEAIRRWRPSP